jgi:hypothetical protein
MLIRGKKLHFPFYLKAKNRSFWQAELHGKLGELSELI